VPAAHGPLTCLQDIDGVYVGQDVLEVELQVRPDGLHHLYQGAVLLGDSGRGARKEMVDN